MRSKGERKVEGGKLLRADLEYGERIESFSLHGDFFIHPEEELDTIESAVEGLPVNAERELLSRRIEQRLDDGTELVGFDVEDVSGLVREVVGDG